MPDARHFARAHRAPLRHRIGQRLSLDELHPDADLLLGLLGAVDGDDVGVADAGEMLRFGQRQAIGRKP